MKITGIDHLASGRDAIADLSYTLIQHCPTGGPRPRQAFRAFAGARIIYQSNAHHRRLSGSSMTSQRPEKQDLPRLAATFLTSAASLSQCPAPTGPEVAFAGRSNAGKSSVLNRLTGSRRTAKVSKSPGRTQLLNFFEVNGGGFLVDLPGYGYAKAGREAQMSWQRSVNEYLSHRDALAGVVLVMDIRHPLQPFDKEVIEWAQASEMPLLILLNKADKLKRGVQARTRTVVRKAVAASPLTRVQVFSAQTGQGLPELITILEEWLSAH
jgi:GTP-binding protein